MIPDIEHGMSLPFNLIMVRGEALVCLTAARILPGRRLVARGTWDGKFVFAKLYTGPKAERDWQREQNGSAAMLMRGVRTARLLHSQRLDNGFVLVYSALEPSSSLADFYARSDDTEKARLRRLCVSMVAELHSAGLKHNDLHLDNFLMYDGELYVIDAGSVESSDNPLSRGQAEDNLAVLLAQFADVDSVEADALYRHYLDERYLEYTSQDNDMFRQRLQVARDYRQRKYLEKVFRECSAFAAESSFDRQCVFAREYDSEELRELLADPDSCMSADDTVMLKDGNTSTVAEVSCGDKRFVIKRYNVKHLWHGVRRMLRSTRAASSWRNAHLLGMLEIPTAKPVAFIENRFGPLRASSYYIMETTEGVRADHYFVDSSVPSQIRQGQAEVLVGLFARLAGEGLVHGDYKASNFMITDHGPLILDLDAMQPLQGKAFREGLEKDLRRFMLNWQGLPDASGLFEPGISALAAKYDIALEE